MNNKENRLIAVAEMLCNDPQAPLYLHRQTNNYKLVFGEGNPDARVMFIGEAPGKDEALTGRPFVGRAGRMLDSLLDGIAVRREDTYIANIIKDRPPDNRAPLKDEIAYYVPFLVQQIEIVQPEIIATLGRYAMDFILKHFNLRSAGQTIGELHGEPIKIGGATPPMTLLPLYHPAAVFYNRQLEPALKTDIQLLGKLLTSSGDPSERKRQ